MTIYLAPTDFSEHAAAGVREAVRRALLNDAEVLLLHVFHVPDDTTQMARPLHFPNLHEETRRAAQQQLETARHELVGERVPVRLLLRDGVPAEEICAVAEEEDADLIVLATRQRTALSRLLLGSTTEKVVRGAPCSVLIYKQKEGGGAAAG